MHRGTARQARGARLELASKVHTHWKREARLRKRHIPGMNDREPDIMARQPREAGPVQKLQGENEARA